MSPALAEREPLFFSKGKMGPVIATYSTVDTRAHGAAWNSGQWVVIPGAEIQIPRRIGKYSKSRGIHVTFSGHCTVLRDNTSFPFLTEPDLEVRMLITDKFGAVKQVMLPTEATFCEDFLSGDETVPERIASMAFVSDKVDGVRTVRAEMRISDSTATATISDYNFTVRVHKWK